MNPRRIYSNEKEVAEHEADSAIGEPFVSLPDQQYIAQPACDKGKQQKDIDFICGTEVVQGQKQQ